MSKGPEIEQAFVEEFSETPTSSRRVQEFVAGGISVEGVASIRNVTPEGYEEERLVAILVDPDDDPDLKSLFKMRRERSRPSFESDLDLESRWGAVAFGTDVLTRLDLKVFEPVACNFRFLIRADTNPTALEQVSQGALPLLVELDTLLGEPPPDFNLVMALSIPVGIPVSGIAPSLVRALGNLAP